MRLPPAPPFRGVSAITLPGAGLTMDLWVNMKMNNILLSSHGTEGAQAAERMAINLSSRQTTLHHLIVVPDLWKGMMGDDWLNNGISRDRYARYLESELGREVEEHCQRVQTQAEGKGVRYRKTVVLGKPNDCLLSNCCEADYDLVVMGSPRPRGKPGIRSRMATEPLARSLTVPLLIVPYPTDA